MHIRSKGGRDSANGFHGRLLATQDWQVFGITSRNTHPRYHRTCGSVTLKLQSVKLLIQSYLLLTRQNQSLYPDLLPFAPSACQLPVPVYTIQEPEAHCSLFLHLSSQQPLYTVTKKKMSQLFSDSSRACMCRTGVTL